MNETATVQTADAAGWESDPEPAIRRIKWLGDPPMVLEDGWRVANWAYENSRVVAIVGYSERIIAAADLPGLTQDYVFGRASNPGKRSTWVDYMQDVPAADALLLLAAMPNEFVDVTDHPHPDAVVHDPIIVYRDKQTGKYYRNR